MKYDIIVAGGGPAGLYASYIAKKNNSKLKILLLEKDKEIGEPILCAEGISNRTLKLFFDKKNYPFIRNIFDSLIIKYKEYKSETKIPDMGVIINRGEFDKYIANMALQVGVEIKTSENIINGEYIDNGIKIITENNEYQAEMLIIADGVESRIASFFNIDTITNLNDIYSCYQYVYKHENIKDNEIVFDFTPEYAGYGYLWIFPRGDNQANFGLGINTNKINKKAKNILKEYKERFYPKGKIIRELAGAVPVNPVKNPYSDRILICGDAARYADPMTGGGIDNAIRTGKFAGEVAVKAFKKNDFSEKFLKEYNRIVKKDNGFFIEKQLKLKNIIENMNEKELDDFFINSIKFFDNKTILSDDFYSTLFSMTSIKNKLHIMISLGKLLIDYPGLMKIIKKLL